MKRKLPLIVVTGSLLLLMGVYFNAAFVGAPPNVIITGKQIQICNRNFLSYEITQAPAGVTLAKARIEVEGLPLPVYAPSELLKQDANLNIVAQINSNLNLPILPDIPILPVDQQNKICPAVQKYADNFGQANVKSAIIARHSVGTKVFTLSNSGNYLGAGLRVGYQEAAVKQNQQKLVAHAQLATMVNAQYTVARQKPAYDFLVIFQTGYENEISDLVEFYTKRNIRTLAIAVNQLPGYNPDGPTPAECSGEYAKECYHTWGDPIQGTSQLAVPSLPGFHGTKAIYQQYSRVSYVPGLVRAYIRAIRKLHPLRGVMLVGNPQTLPPFNSSTTRYYYDGTPDSTHSEKLFTDLFYMMPDVPLVLSTTNSNHLIMSSSLTSCRNLQTQALAFHHWCQDDEWRAWGTPPGRDYRNPAHIPSGRIMEPKYGFYDMYWTTVGLESIIPVGRIVTQDRFLNTKDPVVGRYVNKLKRWYAEMPGMLNNSINSNGGSTSDSWIFTKTDIDQFQTTFGTTSKIFSSEFFVSGYQCAGRCTFKSGPGIMDDHLSSKNHVALFLNGHGGHIAIQGPYANGNIGSSYLSEASSHLNDGLRMKHFEDPAVDTIKIMENSHKLIGVIFANSCSPSDYLLNNQGHYLTKAVYPAANERSWAEQWIAMSDAGALNTYLNGNVGWGGSDNSYNVSFMKKIKSSWENCGTIGDALRSLILDGMRGQNSGSGGWQVLNRHFFGSPLNHIGRLPLACTRYKDVANVVEQTRNN